MKLAKNLIDQAIESGADAVKLQSFKAAFQWRLKENFEVRRKVLGTEETDYDIRKMSYPRGRRKSFLVCQGPLYSLPPLT